MDRKIWLAQGAVIILSFLTNCHSQASEQTQNSHNITVHNNGEREMVWSLKGSNYAALQVWRDALRR